MNIFVCKRILLLISCHIFISLTFAACLNQNNNEIKIGLSAAPVTLDPRYATDAISYRITRLIYRSLIDFDEHYQVVPDLAKWKQITLDHYRFILESSGRRFHNESELTARDVKTTYDSVLDPDNASPHRGSLLMIERIEVVDDNTIDFFLDKPDPLFPGRLVIGVLPARLIIAGHEFSRYPVGSGPMRLLDWPNENDITLQRLSDNQSIRFLTVKDSTVRVLKLIRGEVDILQGDLPPEMIRWLERQQEVKVEKVKGNTFTYIGFNLDSPVTSNLKVRKAIAHAIDRGSIIEFVMGNAAREAGALLPPDHWSGHRELHGYHYDPDRARELLRDAGYGGSKPLHLIYKTSNNPFRLRLATIIQDQLKDVGIHIDIRSYDWGTFYGDIKSGRFQMYSLSWVGLKMPDIFRYIFHSSAVPPQGANRGRFINSRADELIEAAETTLDLERQAGLYRDLQEHLHEQLPYVPLWYEDNILAIRHDLASYSLVTDGNYDGLITIKRIRLNYDND
jgi:peptide/nickel transport system substrate-binding protein